MCSDLDSEQLCLLVSESFGLAIIDTGCPRTVCGKDWLKVYIDTLSAKDRSSIFTESSSHKFRFGNGMMYKSEKYIVVPIYVDGNRHELGIEVINCTIPLLLSRETLERANARIDIADGSIEFSGNNVPMITSTNGHLCLQIGRLLDSSNTETQRVINTVLFTSPLSNIDKTDLKRKVLKLHKQFAHPSPNKLSELVKNAGTDDEHVHDMIHEISRSCEVCHRFKRRPPRPAVGFPLASQFNETVALDLKAIGPNVLVLHMVDHLTRYSSACIISNKKKETIVRALFDYWIRIFGCPHKFLSDNGGEFVNKDVIDMAEKCNVTLETTAAESAWSNGLCEKHNGILGNMISKIMRDKECPIEIAIHWAVAAKNSLSNVYGFCPNILVFGRNPNFPSAMTNSPPANNLVSISQYVADNLNTMHAAREIFVQQESAEKLRRGLCKKTRTHSDTVFCQGDHVYYWRDKSMECHGPAVVIGQDGQQILIKHGGYYVRVHPCRLQLCEKFSISTNNNIDDASSSQVEQPNNSDESESEDEALSNADAVNTQVEHPNNSDESELEDKALSNTDGVDESWVTVRTHHDLPKPKTDVECVFPNLDGTVRCHILSKAGKSSTQNWHYLNIREGEHSNGKCCSFKGALWKLSECADNADTDVPLPTDNASSDVGNTQSLSTYTETFYGSCEQKSAFQQPKLEEIQKWRDMHVFDEVPDCGQKTISTRWVCTRKIKGGQVVHKARLVARGFEENTSQLKTDSPTCAKESFKLLLTIIASNSWKLHSLDVKSAFLQGIPINREVFIKPPKEAETSLLWKLLICVYGLADAGRHWYLKVLQVLLSLDVKQSKYDQALFMWYHDGILCGIMACHVDDFIFGGTELFHQTIIDQVRSLFIIGMEENTTMKFLGLQIDQTSDGIVLSTKSYAMSLSVLDKEICNALSCKGKSEFSSDEVKAIKQLSGQINWLVTQARPDIAYEGCIIGNSLTSGNSAVFSSINKVIRKIQNQDVVLHFYSDLDTSNVSIVTFCDASFANLPNGGSQGSYITFLVDQNGLYSPITWQSRKIPRVVKSTTAAECLAAVTAAEMTIYLATLLQEILHLSDGCIKTYVFCDNDNLVKAVHSSTNMEDRRLLIDVSVLRDLLQKGELGQFRWVNSKLQVADSLTKQGACNKNLVRILNDKLTFDFSTGRFA